MKIKLLSIVKGQWDVVVNGEKIGKARTSPLYGYVADLESGVKIMAFSQKDLKSVIVKHLTKESV